VADAVDDLLTRAFTDPAEAIASASSRLETANGTTRVELLRVIGNASRELQRIDDSVGQLRTAVDEAVALGDTELEGRCSMSLAASLSYSGDFEQSISTGQRAVELLSGDVTAMSQLAGLQRRAGRHAEALESFTQALAAAARSDDRSIEADLLCNRGVLYGWTGEIEAAEDDTRRALELYEDLGWTKWSADARYNLAWLAARRGDLIEAFRRFDDAEQTYEALGVGGAAMVADRGEALLAAGLAAEAVTFAEQAATELRAQGDDVDLAETLMLVARAAMLAGDNERAANASAEATELFSAQDRAGWSAAAVSLSVEARIRAGVADDGDVQRIVSVIGATRTVGLASACAEARLVAAELAAARGEWESARRHLDAVDRSDLGLSARCRLDLLRTRELAAAGRGDEALATCAVAVDEFGELTAELGGTELRAHIARHVADLVTAGLTLAVERSDAGLAFEWSERQRASALAVAPVRPPDDAEVAADLDRLRAALTRLDTEVRDGTRHGGAAPDLTPDSARLQERIRRRTRLSQRAGSSMPRPGTVADVAGAGLAAWVSYVEVGDRLIALRVEDGAATMVDLGAAAAARREASLFRSVLTMHLNAVGRGVERDPAPVLASAAEADALLLRPLDLLDGPVVISPIAGLHDLPWGLLPSLRERSFVLAPSVALWKRCREVATGVPGRAVSVAGPGLPFADVEVERVARPYASSTVQTGADASVAAVATAMSTADVVHFACHGRFSAENPMFSSLLVGDGPMFVYDLERVAPLPKIVVLSACHAGAHATPTGREILGLTASLLAAGPRAVIAATVPIPDTLGTVDVMARLHAGLGVGRSPADALLDARRADPIVGGAFATHGAH
jgi:tetratricopeptide (TPR) repeat protein